MKTRIIRSLGMVVLAFTLLLPINAQRLYKDAILVSDAILWQAGNTLQVKMIIDISNLKVAKDRSLTLTPVLIGANNNVALDDIIINGKRRQKVYLRAMALNKAANLEMPNAQTDIINFSQTIPYQPWMENATLNLVENLCGCGGHQEELNQELIMAELSTEASRAPKVVVPPVVIPPKIFYESYESHLDFPVSKSVILTDYMNNNTEMANIQALFDKIKNDKSLTITEIHIDGFASPEGPLKFNEELSRNRAEALKNYLVNKEGLPEDMYKVSFGGENWDGLVKALQASDMKDKDTFLNIIRNTSDDATRKQEIMKVGGGAPYRMMLKNIYPGLRKVNLRIGYKVVEMPN